MLRRNPARRYEPIDTHRAIRACVWGARGDSLREVKSVYREPVTIEQILINLVAGALGGMGAGKASPNFDLGPIGPFGIAPLLPGRGFGDEPGWPTTCR